MVFLGRSGQGKVNRLRSKLRTEQSEKRGQALGIEEVPSCLVPGPGVIRPGDKEMVRDMGSALIGLYTKGDLSGKLFIIIGN